MSTDQVWCLITVGAFSTLVVTYQLLRIWQDRQTAADDGWVYDGPDSLRLLEDLDHDLDEHLGRLAPLFDQLGPPQQQEGEA